LFKKISHRFSDIVLSFAAGVMLAAAVLGLILPSLEYGGKFGLLVTVAGVFVGAICLNLTDRAAFTLYTNRVFLCIMKRTIRRPVFGMEGIISGFFDFSIDGLDDFTNLLYPFLVVFNYELCFFYPWMQDEPV